MKKKKPPVQRKAADLDGVIAHLVAHSLEQTQINKFHTKGGVGFSAEDANHFCDLLRLSQAQVVGVSNELNGADRLVDGVLLQSKYFNTAAKTVYAAFDRASGLYRYTGQMLEVPRDQYEACIKLMQKRIASGQVPGFKKAEDAEKLVRKGSVTYKQARNIARAGKVESLMYDAATQSVNSTCVFAISFALSYAQQRWSGEPPEGAETVALTAALSAAGTTLVTGVLTAQLLRTRAAAVGVVGVRNGVRAISRTSLGRQAVYRVAAGSLGKAVYGGAAINHVAKLLRSNAVAATVAALATITPDLYRAAFAKSISWKQFAKNASVNTVGVAGGAGGWFAGAAAGAAVGTVVPVVGTAAGGVVGGVVGAITGGVGSAAVAKKAADTVAEDDSTVLLTFLESELLALSAEYMLMESEIPGVSGAVNSIVDRKWLARMYMAKSKDVHDSDEALRLFVRAELEPVFQEVIEAREVIPLPRFEHILEDVAHVKDVLAEVGLADGAVLTPEGAADNGARTLSLDD